ncbi:hypothetical protein BCR41DRAFT_359398 [Lobosporangium transversale]|uniref:Uncharacterized protein n=1 Tax=Lobosporangium transversale TaxID=64571 RepID=A0A1Y2GGN2_9FUNG|nr:hypothetical protein BCR41DRAFT_359398 [Lobosporangium transversale]ORZ08553.1 hypothetical protein BCR41DRAFT_359398 [Lobosporangium transversale]|eukprot:XP_021878481.1 hypothetical protein BCR41DRAFT_359398 [Lobosporangium transversale]
MKYLFPPVSSLSFSLSISCVCGQPGVILEYLFVLFLSFSLSLIFFSSPIPLTYSHSHSVFQHIHTHTRSHFPLSIRNTHNPVLTSNRCNYCLFRHLQ